ncbi:MAG: PaaI family thioesterase [Dehalococcoidia bacterium]|nr:PaaI family thioesterase [Dehalococcoidia bacterium]
MPEEPNEIFDAVTELKTNADGEPIASFLKMRLVELSEGYAKVMIKVMPEYQNFNGLTFGGIIMAVADQSFAYASNSLSYPSAASQFNIHFLTGASVGDELTAECQVLKSGRRVGISDITVTNQKGKIIAKATGTTIPITKLTY